MIEWFARNSVAANLLMVTIIVAGLLSASRLIPLEVFPSFEIEAVSINTVFRGATPDSVKDGVTSRIEEAIYNIEGVKQISSRSAESLSVVVAEVEEGYNRRKILNDIKLKIDALNTLPIEAERPVVALLVENQPVIQVAISGDVNAISLRAAADQVRNDLLANADITLVELLGVTDHEISIEVSSAELNRYNLSLTAIAQAIRQGSVDISAGNIKTRGGDIAVRADGQAYSSTDFSSIPVIYRRGSDPVLLGDIATITDGFEQQPLFSEFDDKPSIMLKVSRTGEQSSLALAQTVRDYVAQYNINNTNEITLAYWDDDSRILKARLATLLKSGVQGGILVLLLLSLFLRPAIAFWVFLGIPVSFMGAFIFMPLVGGTFNIMSLFAFITVLGIVVDDAIVTGENIYRKMHEGLEPLQASIVGTKQIAIPVTFGILTTAVAFYPMSDLGANRLGFLAAQVPMVVIPVLLFSLIESKLVLPSHLSHITPRAKGVSRNWLTRTQMTIARGLENWIVRSYEPFLNRCLKNKTLVIACLLAAAIIIFNIAKTGYVKFTFFPRVEAEHIQFGLTMPDTTGFETTDQYIQAIAAHLSELQEKYRDPDTGTSIIRHIYSTSGSSGNTVKPSVGMVSAELIGPEERSIQLKASELAREARNLIGEIPGAEKLSVRAEIGRGGEPIDVELSGTSVAIMSKAGDAIRQQLKQYPYVFDIQDNFSGGKEELNIVLNQKAHTLGLSLSDVANQVRGSVFGLEAQRIQRGREEVRVMVRLPENERSSLDDLMRLPIRIGQNNAPIPLSDLAEVTPVRSPTTLYRLNREAIIDITADVDKDQADVPAILRDLRLVLDEQVKLYPGLNYTFKGEAEEQAENNAGFTSGLVIVLISIYALLAIPFKSYAQPLIVMSVIPFSMAGAILGHIITGYDLSILSMVGMLALVGVVVNDSLVLVDYINQQRKKGAEVFQAALASGAARFRPVILTSLTTFAGLTPLLFDSSTQSQFLKPMAISLGFGILFATLITLIIVPVNYLLGHQLKHSTKRLLGNTWRYLLAFWHGGSTAK